jgi:hypothetical protein
LPPTLPVYVPRLMVVRIDPKKDTSDADSSHCPR